MVLVIQRKMSCLWSFAGGGTDGILQCVYFTDCDENVLCIFCSSAGTDCHGNILYLCCSSASTDCHDDSHIFPHHINDRCDDL